jgi:hypothetical protein
VTSCMTKREREGQRGSIDRLTHERPKESTTAVRLRRGSSRGAARGQSRPDTLRGAAMTGDRAHPASKPENMPSTDFKAPTPAKLALALRNHLDHAKEGTLSYLPGLRCDTSY